MFRKLFPLIGILILAVALAACGASTAQGTAADAPHAAQSGAAMEHEAHGQEGEHAEGHGQDGEHAEEHDQEGEHAEEHGQDGAHHGGQEGGHHDGHGMMVTPEGTITDAEAADLLHMREEEKLARDVYLALYDKWQLPVFQHIARAEQKHMDAIGNLITGFGLEDPVAQTQDQRGVFVNADLQDLYNQLVAQGSASEVDALKVGATIEDLDIKDLDDALARTENDSVATVFQNLKRGSEAHMRAFVSNLRARGADYSPQYISAEAFQQILEGSRGHGQGAGGGHGCGNGGNAEGHGHGHGAQETPTAQP